MNYESFSDKEVVDILNLKYIPVKVSVEERPDIAGLFYKVVNTIRGYGGYPITMILTYDERPIFADSYVPKYSNSDIMGLVDILKDISSKWDKNKNNILINNRNIIYYLDKYYKGKGISSSYCSNAFEDIYKEKIKKSNSKNLIIILKNNIWNLFKRNKQNKSKSTFNKTLNELEKMLYKKSFLVASYLEAYTISKDILFKNRDLNYIEDSLRNDVLQYKDKVLEATAKENAINSWICLMIAALGKAYNIIEDDKYLKSAKKAVDLIYIELMKDNNIEILDDYTYMILGLIELYEGTYDVEYIKKAVIINRKMINLFWDNEDGGFYLYNSRNEKDNNESSRPSGNSIATYTLTKLAKLTGDLCLEKYAIKQIEYVSKNVDKNEMKYSFFCIAASFKISVGKKLVCLLKDKKDINKVKVALKKKEDFELTTIVVTKENKKEFESIAKFLKNYAIVNDKSTYYLCENHNCKTPVNDIKEIFI